MIARARRIGIAFAILASGSALPAPQRAAETTVSFHRDVRPILEASCQGCHQPAKAKGGLDLTGHAALLRGGRGGACVIPGDADASLLVELITADGDAPPEMPERGTPLSAAEIARIRNWIAEGAIDDTPATAAVIVDAEHPPEYVRPPAVPSIDATPDGRLLAIAGYHEVLLTDADGGLVARLIGAATRVESVAFSPDASLLAVAGGTPARFGEVQIWRVADRSLRQSVRITHDVLRGVSWSPDGKRVAFGGADNSVRAIDVASGEQVLYQGAHEDWVLDTVFSVDGSHLVSVGRDRSMKLIQVATQQFIDNITSITPGALKGGLIAVIRHPREDTLLVGGADGMPRMFRMFREQQRVIGDDYNLVRSLPALPGRVCAAAWSADARHVAVVSSDGAAGMLRVHTADDGAIGFEASLPAPTYAVAFLAATDVVTAGQDGTLRIFALADGRQRAAFSPFPLRAAGESKPVATGRQPARGDLASAGPLRIDGLTVWPPRIELTTPFEYAQLQITCAMDEGRLVDVTRSIRCAPCDLLAVDASGLVRPRRDGTGVLRLEVEGRPIELAVTVSGQNEAVAPLFTRDVAPVLSRVGCNAGTCHGSAAGKRGFKLSLRGYDPVFDHHALTDDLAGRRVDRAVPADSLFLHKPTATVPHEGGRVLDADGTWYQLLRAWVESGAELVADAPALQTLEILPPDPVVGDAGDALQMVVLAHYADGAMRDVTHEAFVETDDTEVVAVDGGAVVRAKRRGEAAILARYEGHYIATRLTVMGDRQGFTWSAPPEHNFIDGHIYAKLRRVRVDPAGLCSDAEFVRRVYLDLTGLAPTADEVKTFLIDQRDPRVKRDEVIERLLGSAGFVAHWSRKWADLLLVNAKFLGDQGAAVFRDWLREQVASNLPYDEFVRRILTGSGSTLEHPPAAWFKVLRKPDELMENTTQVFLGTRFSCNKCHDHPFERWTQNDHWQLAAFFSHVGRRNAEGSPLMPEKGGNQPEDERLAYEELIADVGHGEVTHPNSGAVMSPRFPFDLARPIDAGESRREQLAQWLTAAENPYFARSYVNRVWSYLLGRGLIDPVDDIRPSNPATHPELLEQLTDGFIASGFDVRWLLRTICRSRTYQHSIATSRWNADDTINYSHAYARRLPAEVLFDLLHQATGSKTRLPGVRPGTRAVDLVDASVEATDGFLGLFGRPPRESACECERGTGVSLGQALNLVNGPTVAEAIADPHNAIADLLAVETQPAAIIEQLYLAFLCRYPTAEETLRLARTFDPGDPANLAALDPSATAELHRRIARFEAETRPAVWQPARLLAGRSLGGATIAAHDDGSLLVSGANPDRDTLSLVFTAAAGPIRGLRLEALADPSLPAMGPGRAPNGNFVLTELLVAAIPAGDPAGATPLVLTAGGADFAQQGFAAAAAVDGDLAASGWAISPRLGQSHSAVYETAIDVGGDAGTTLAVTLVQTYGGAHTLGRLRLSTTSSARPIRHAELPAAVASALQIPAAERDETQTGLIAAYYVATDVEMVGLLRQGATRDLAWALANSKAFLFNR